MDLLELTKGHACRPNCVDQIAISRGMTPIDVVKTRIQIDPSFKGAGMMSTGRQIIAKEGTKGLFTGCVPFELRCARVLLPPLTLNPALKSQFRTYCCRIPPPGRSKVCGLRVLEEAACRVYVLSIEGDTAAQGGTAEQGN